MADERNELKQINWNEMFAFTRIFKSFKLGLNLSNLTLGLAVVLLVCLTGWVMDEAFSWTGQTVIATTATDAAGQKTTTSELDMYSGRTAEQFEQIKKTFDKNRPEIVVGMRIRMASEKVNLRQYISELSKTEAGNGHFIKAFTNAVDEENKKADEAKAPDREKVLKNAKEDWDEVQDKTESLFAECVSRIGDHLKPAYEKAEKTIENDADMNEEDKSKALDRLDDDYVLAQKALTTYKTEFRYGRGGIDSIRGVAISSSFIAYEGKCLKKAVFALLHGNIATGLDEYRQKRQLAVGEPGFLVQILKALDGVTWMLSQHWLYAIIFLLVSLAIWALLGGAIHRIAAVQAARDEKISLVQALRFSSGKFMSFFFAPLIPLVIIFAVGALIMLGGLLTNIPFVGPIIVGVLFIFALLLGLLIAFILIGFLTSGGLMYPTIAVEGSDSFDAMSRSFSYVFSRPWSAALYAIVALVHGAICYVFVRVFVFIALSATHFFVKSAVWSGGQTLPGVASADKMDVLWLAPTFRTLHAWNWQAMGVGESIGAICVMIWVYLIIGMVAAFALSYLAGSTTSIYYLLRRKVDATDLDDVYTEEEPQPQVPAAEEEQVETPAPAEEPKSEETPAEEKQTEETPAEEEEEEDKKTSEPESPSEEKE